MTTTIHSTVSERELRISDNGTYASVHLVGNDKTMTIKVDRAEFLAAVAAECDAIIIPRTDLPEVTGTRQCGPDGEPIFTFADGLERVQTTDDLPRLALAYLAAMEYVKEHPPVDQAAVDALATLLADEMIADAPSRGIRDLARRLVAAGVRAPEGGVSR